VKCSNLQNSSLKPGTSKVLECRSLKLSCGLGGQRRCARWNYSGWWSRRGLVGRAEGGTVGQRSPQGVRKSCYSSSSRRRGPKAGQWHRFQFRRQKQHNRIYDGVPYSGMQPALCMYFGLMSFLKESNFVYETDVSTFL
jgi:hypothetical protein